MNTRYLTLGTFVVVTLGAFTWLALQLGLGDRDGAHYTVRTPDAAGLVEGNSVRIAGVEVGKVGSIRVDGNTAVIDVRIRPGTTVTADACAAVHIKGMLGEKYLGIAQGESPAAMAPGATFDCVTATVDFDNALNAAREMVYGEESLLPPITRVAKRIDKFTAVLDEDTGEDSTRGRLDRMLGGVETMLATGNEMLTENRGDLRAIAQAGRKRLEDPRIDKILDSTVKLLDTANRRIPPMLDQGERILDKLEKATDLLDAEHIAQIDGMLDDGAVALKNLRKLSDDFKDVGKELKPALKGIAPLLKDLGTIAHRAAGITEETIRQMLQMEGFRVRIGQGREAREFMKASKKAD